MKLGIVPLWSAWNELSNDVLNMDFNVGHIFAKNRTQAKAIIHGFSWFWVKIQLTAKRTSLNTPFMLITMVQVPPPYLIPSPRYLAKYIVQTSISLILGWYPRILFCGFNFSLGITKYQSDALSTKPLCPWQRSSTQAAYSGAYIGHSWIAASFYLGHSDSVLLD